MKIFAISVVKNEADVIKYNLLEAAKWADKIFVLDNGSGDNTWEIVKSLKSEKIIPWKSEDKAFYDGIRAEVYHEFKHLADAGDWWCFRLDADEFYADNPVEFLTRVSSKYHFVATDTIHFKLTSQDLEEGLCLDDSDNNVDYIKYYESKTWSEARFFRHRKDMIWEVGGELPKHMGILSPDRIKVKHYQYRSLKQIERRIATRTEAIKSGFVGWDHASNQNLDTYLGNQNDLNKYNQDNGWHLSGSINKNFQRKYDVIIKRFMFIMGIYK